MKKSLLALAFAVASLTPLAAVQAQTVLNLGASTNANPTVLTLGEIGAAAGAQSSQLQLYGTPINIATDDFYFKLTSPASGVQLSFADNISSSSPVTASIVGTGDTFTVYPTGVAANTTFSLAPNTEYELQVTSAGIASFGANLTAVSAAPEPSTWALMVLGIGAIGVAMRRSRRAAASALVAA